MTDETPLKRDTAQELVAPDATSGQSDPEASGPAPKPAVLVVDDNDAMSLFLANLLHARYDVATAECAGKALAYIQRTPPDAVILDLQLRDGTDGHEVLDAIRRGRTKTDIPVLVLSGSNDSEDRVASLQRGAQDYLAKPFHPAELRERLARMV